MPSPIESFRALHDGRQLLRLPNAWDAGSARLFESLGAPAIATTSAGMAWAAGYPDGNKMPADIVVSIAASIVRVLKVPLSVDIENGYSADPTSVAALVSRLAHVGVAGINLEDGGDAPELLAAKIGALKSALNAQGQDVFVNARTDVFLAKLVEAPRLVAETLKRARLYADAGADGIFVPGVAAAADIRELVAGIDRPLNVMAWAGLPDARELHTLGVRRLSAGSAISQMVWGHAQALAQAFLDPETGSALQGTPMPYAQLQGLFRG